ncbi:MAG: hypothetical protein IJD92_05015 [Bacilli bacterium]|nr:hypothetical protein [Bacilli bacterium]
MNLLTYLKKIKHQLLSKKNTSNNKTDSDNINNVDNIELIIENYNNLFENEPEIIKNGALVLLENGNVNNLEEGIIVFATMIRGLKYKKTQKEENGKTRIILRDFKPENIFTKKL